MKAVYFKSGQAEWKFELDDEEHDLIIKNILEDEPDMEEMLNDSLEVIRDVSAMDESEMDEDDQIDQTVSVAFIWHYFNNVPPEKGGVDGDVALIENEDGDGVMVVAAKDVIEE
ncbi:MAG: hypothetical protein H3C38_04225 [Rhodospirillales bacterium]|nr:hypothetical protein [Rhodospirillales bacterium]